MTSREKKGKNTTNQLCKRQTKIFEGTRFTRSIRSYYVINNCDVGKGVFVANLNAKRKKFFFHPQPSKLNNTVEQIINITAIIHA